MKLKRVRCIVFLLLVVIAFALFANIKVITKQGVDYKVQSITIPLYLKILDFFDRHFNYIELVKRITAQAANEEEKIIKIFKWTYNHIQPQPRDLPIIDDHVWNIIIRGYGAGEQSSDVFTTLCNYANMDAFYSYLHGKDGGELLVASFVKIDGEWSVFDLRKGAYFKRRDGKLATIEDFGGEDWIVDSISPALGDLKNYYLAYAENILSLDYNKCQGYSRGSRQSPLNRLIFQLKKFFRN